MAAAMAVAVVMVAADATVTEPFPRPRSLLVRPVHAASQSNTGPFGLLEKAPERVFGADGQARRHLRLLAGSPRKNTTCGKKAESSALLLSSTKK